MSAGNRPLGWKEAETGTATREVDLVIRRINGEPIEGDTFTPFGTFTHVGERSPLGSGAGRWTTRPSPA
jgi:hypothetical protein